MASSLFFIFLTLISLPIYSLSSTFTTRTNRFRPDFVSYLKHSELSSTTPTTFFEVTKPIQLPKTKPCSYLLLQHEFGYTYGSPPVSTNYTPPSSCPSQDFAKIVLEWKATSKGRQFDRIFGIWVSGVEIFRSSTAEPTATGIVWTVRKDITRYHSLLMKNQILAVYLGNLVNNIYTGSYNVELSIHFYPTEKRRKAMTDNSFSGYNSKADLILPISRSSQMAMNDGLWFRVDNSANTQMKEFVIPKNVYKAVLEVYLSFHENDEFWYTNFPNEFITKNNITASGNGPFREVVVTLDSLVVGAVWPFTVIYTGGFNPLLWRPISGIGSFDLPSYDIDLTPFLETLLDSKNHMFGFSVTNALHVWYIDANLHLWVDENSVKTEAKLLVHNNSPLNISPVSNFNGFNGTFLVSANRSISSTGWVKSSKGNITTQSNQEFTYVNSMILKKNGNLQIVNQTIDFKGRVITQTPSTALQETKSFKNFPLYLYTEAIDQGNKSYRIVFGVKLGFNEKNVESSKFGDLVSSLENLQSAESSLFENTLAGGIWSTKQELFAEDYSKECYFRNINSSNYIILYDNEGKTCR